MKKLILIAISFLTLSAIADPPTPPTTAFVVREWGNNVMRNEVCNGTNAACGGPVSEHPTTKGIYSRYEESLSSTAGEYIWITKQSYFKSSPAYHSTTDIYEWLTNDGGGMGRRDTTANFGEGPVYTSEAITSIEIDEPEFAFGTTTIVVPTTEYGQTVFSTEAALSEYSKTVLRGVGGTHHYSYTYRVFFTCEEYQYNNALNLVLLDTLAPTGVGNNLSFYDATQFNLPGWWYVDVTLGMEDAGVIAEVDVTPKVLGGHYYKYDFLTPQLLSTMPYSPEITPD